MASPISRFRTCRLRCSVAPAAQRSSAAAWRLVTRLLIWPPQRLQAFSPGLAQEAAVAASASTLNAFMAMGNAAWSALRAALSDALRTGSAHEGGTARLPGPAGSAEYTVPARIGDYTDFYTSIYHATNIGKQFRPDNPLLPNYKWCRSATTAARRPGWSRAPRCAGRSVRACRRARLSPSFGPCKRLDYELEMGIYVGPGNALGNRVAMADAESHVFGLCLLNDWSARDIQGWGVPAPWPFLSKNFGSTLSPWIVTMEALAPYRTAWTRPADDPQPLPYLDAPDLRSNGAIDIQLAVTLSSAKMRADNVAPHTLCRTSYRHAYWTIAQLVTHHTVNGCNLQPG